MLLEYCGKFFLSERITGFVGAEAFRLADNRNICRIGNCQKFIPEFKLTGRSHIRCALVDIDNCKISDIFWECVVCFDCVFRKSFTRLRSTPYRAVSYHKKRIFFVNIHPQTVNLLTGADFGCFVCFLRNINHTCVIGIFLCVNINRKHDKC